MTNFSLRMKPLNLLRVRLVNKVIIRHLVFNFCNIRAHFIFKQLRSWIVLNWYCVTTIFIFMNIIVIFSIFIISPPKITTVNLLFRLVIFRYSKLILIYLLYPARLLLLSLKLSWVNTTMFFLWSFHKLKSNSLLLKVGSAFEWTDRLDCLLTLNYFDSALLCNFSGINRLLSVDAVRKMLS